MNLVQAEKKCPIAYRDGAFLMIDFSPLGSDTQARRHEVGILVTTPRKVHQDRLLR